jgi:hypothetical protein
VNARLKHQKPSIFIDGFITKILQAFFCPKQNTNLPNDKTFPNGRRPIKVKEMDDIKQVMKHTDYYQQDFGLLFQHGRQLAKRTWTNKILI